MTLDISFLAYFPLLALQVQSKGYPSIDPVHSDIFHIAVLPPALMVFFCQLPQTTCLDKRLIRRTGEVRAGAGGGQAGGCFDHHDGGDEGDDGCGGCEDHDVGDEGDDSGGGCDDHDVGDDGGGGCDHRDGDMLVVAIKQMMMTNIYMGRKGDSPGTPITKSSLGAVLVQSHSAPSPEHILIIMIND